MQALVKKKGVSVIHGTAKIISANQIEVSSNDSTKLFNAKEIVLATGSKPVELPFYHLMVKELFIVTRQSP